MKWLGLAFATLLGLAALLAEGLVPVAAVGLVLIAALLVANGPGVPASFRPGVAAASKHGLFLAIVLLGFRLQWADLRAVGEHWMLLLPALLLPMAIAFVLRKRYGNTAVLVGIGTAICGASAIAAARPGLRADDDEVAAAVGTVTLLGAVGLVAYPALAWALQVPETAYGMWAGLTLHAVPQAVGAGFAVSAVAGGAATTFKLARVACLPIVLLATNSRGARVPKEVIGFLLAVLLANSGLLSPDFRFFLAALAKVPLVIAIGAIGLQTSLRTMRMGRALGMGLAVWLPTAALVLLLAWMQS
ncbi:MAG: YeiH family protein [Thermoplasmatota archaeon]